VNKRLMIEEQTTAAVQHYLDALEGDTPAEPIVRALLDRSVRRLQVLCANLLYRAYPRLVQPPVNLRPDELLGAGTVRRSAALGNRHAEAACRFFSCCSA
jgi:hypothetical protein